MRSLYSDALVSYATGNTAHAHEAIERVLAGRPDHLPSMFLSGLVDLQLGSYASAEASLRKVLARAPEDPNAGRVLALVYLKQGRAGEALEMLEPVLAAHPDNAVLLRTAGEAYLATGNPALAATSYERANASTSPTSAARCGWRRFGSPPATRNAALSDLEALATSADPSQVQADLALFTAHMRRREYDKALAAVDALEKKQPKSALVPTLRGVVYLAKRDLKNARKSLEKALEIEPDFYSAAFSLAVIDIREGQPQVARERYDRILAKNPKNEQVLLANVELIRLMGGTPAQVKAAFDKAVDANPTSVRARLALINDSLRLRDGGAAVTAAQAALAVIPDDAAAARCAGHGPGHGRGRQSGHRHVQEDHAAPTAESAGVRASRRRAGHGQGLHRGDRNGAQGAGAQAGPHADLGRDGKDLHACRASGDALAEARKVQKSQPDKATGYAIEGEVLAAQKKWTEAAAAFQGGLATAVCPRSRSAATSRCRRPASRRTRQRWRPSG